MQKFALPFVAACLVVSVGAGLLLTSDVQMWAMVISMFCVIALPIASRPLAAALAVRLRLLVAIGVALVLSSFAAMAAGITLWPKLLSGRAIGLSIWPMLMGFAIGYLPFTARSMSRSWADLEERRKSPPKVIPAMQAKGNVAEALVLLSRERGAVAWEAGPWFVAYCSLPLVLLAMIAAKPTSKAGALEALLGLLAFLLAFISLPMIASIRWTRYLATGQRGSLFSIPLGALWGFLWRWLFAGAVVRFVGRAEPWLQSQLPSAAHWFLSGLADLFSLLVLVLASPWAMIFIAVALGAQDRSTHAALKIARGSGRGIYVGMLLILAPSTVLLWLTGLVPTGHDMTGASWAAYLAFALIYFLTLIVATTYLTNLYLRGSGQGAAAAS